LALALENMGQRKFSAAIAQYAKDAARTKEAKTRYELMPGILSKPKTPLRALMEAFGDEKPTPKVAPAQKEANRRTGARPQPAQKIVSASDLCRLPAVWPG